MKSFRFSLVVAGALLLGAALSSPASAQKYLVSSDDGITAFDNSGTSLGLFTSGGPALDGPAALAFGPDGNLYVLNGGTSIERYNGTTGAFIDAFASGNGLQEPMSLAFGPDGNLYVGDGSDQANFAQDSILRFNATTGAFVDTFATGDPDLADPNGMVFGADGKLYVATEGPSFGNPSFGLVLRYTTAGAKDTFVSDGSGGIQEPFGLVFGSGNDLFVASGDSGEVYRYDGATGAAKGVFITGLQDPKGIVFVPAAVPEPGSVALLIGMGMTGAGVLLRHRRSK